MRYPVVLFDAGETLIGPRESLGATYARVLATLGLKLTPASLESALRDSWTEISAGIPAGTDRYRHFDDGEQGYWLRVARRTIERTAREPVTQEFIGTALTNLRAAFLEREAWTIYADVLPALSELRASGARLGIVSNWDSRLPQVLERLDLAQHFEVVTVSHEEGIEKPNPEIFRRTLQRIGAQPKEAIHVGDVHDLDVIGANAAGIDAVLLDRSGTSTGKPNVISSLRELPRIATRGLPA